MNTTYMPTVRYAVSNSTVSAGSHVAAPHGLGILFRDNQSETATQSHLTGRSNVHPRDLPKYATFDSTYGYMQAKAPVS